MKRNKCIRIHGLQNVCNVVDDQDDKTQLKNGIEKIKSNILIAKKKYFKFSDPHDTLKIEVALSL